MPDYCCGALLQPRWTYKHIQYLCIHWNKHIYYDNPHWLYHADVSSSHKRWCIFIQSVIFSRSSNLMNTPRCPQRKECSIKKSYWPITYFFLLLTRQSKLPEHNTGKWYYMCCTLLSIRVYSYSITTMCPLALENSQSTTCLQSLLLLSTIYIHVENFCIKFHLYFAHHSI